MNEIGTKIFEVRKRKGFSQEELSDSAKINLRTLQRIEKGETVPHGNTLKNLCQVLELNIEDILDYGKVEDFKFLQFFHLSVLTGIVIPFGNVIVPLILWLTQRNKIIGLNEQGVDLVNFQILWSLLFNVSIIVFAVMKIQHYGSNVIAVYIAVFLYLANIIYPIIVSVSIGKKGLRKYYFSLIRFIK